MDKLGIFGGTFNPIHNGHVSLAKHYIQALGLDELLVIPTKQPPHKSAPDLAPASARLRLCRLAFAGVPEAVVSDMEIVRSGKSYTVDTVAQLRAMYPHAELYLLVGSDMFLTFSQWRQWQRILQERFRRRHVLRQQERRLRFSAEVPEATWLRNAPEPKG